MKTIIKLISILFVVSFGLISCATTHTMDQHQHDGHDQNKHTSKNTYALQENAITQTGSKGYYRVSLYCNESPIPLSKIHNWTVHIETLDGKPVENANVFVFGGMPMHRHDFPTVPKVKKYLGNGDYLVEGIKFNMIGHWEMRFTIKKGKTKDRVKFKIHM